MDAAAKIKRAFRNRKFSRRKSFFYNPTVFGTPLFLELCFFFSFFSEYKPNGTFFPEFKKTKGNEKNAFQFLSLLFFSFIKIQASEEEKDTSIGGRKEGAFVSIGRYQ